jgi:hypothetical protein
MAVILSALRSGQDQSAAGSIMSAEKIHLPHWESSPRPSGSQHSASTNYATECPFLLKIMNYRYVTHFREDSRYGCKYTIFHRLEPNRSNTNMFKTSSSSYILDIFKYSMLLYYYYYYKQRIELNWIIIIIIAPTLVASRRVLFALR